MIRIISIIILSALTIGAKAQLKVDSIVLYYPFSGNANDYSGDSLHGQVMGATLAMDRFSVDSNAYDFDGTNDYIIVPDTSLIKQPAFPFSVSVWVKIRQYNSKFISIFKSCESAANYCGYSMTYSPTGYISAGYANGGVVSVSNRRTRHTYETLSLNEWHHILVSFNNNAQIDIFIDGNTTTGYYSGGANTIGYLPVPGVIGRNAAPSGTFYHDGLIDDLRVYKDSTNLADAKFLSFESPCAGNINLYDTIPYFDTTVVFDTIIHFDTISFTKNIEIVDTLLLKLPIGIDEDFIREIKIYPNPTSSFIEIDLGDDWKNQDLTFVTITNEAGKNLYRQPISKEIMHINLAKIGPSGTYIIQFMNEAGQVVGTRKIVLLR